ncbi:MAG: MATE family efflux transporter [Lachnospiraceae bacterium]|nr:MATE family efflux transporter [Lachnospiraceae bacterium]
MTETELHYKKMTETPVAKLVIKLGIPTTISMLITNIYNMADTYFVGTLGESEQAATGILFTLQAIIQAIAFMLGQGSGTMVAKALADKNKKEASEYVSTAFFVGASAGTILMVGGLLFLEPFMRLLGSTDTILPHAKDYGMWVLISCPIMVCSLILNNNLRYEGKAFYAMIGLTTGGILNIFGDYLLIKVVGLEVFGAGMSTAVSQFISFIILLFFHKKMAQGAIKLKHVSRKPVVIFTVMRVGFPALIRQGFTSISHGLLNNLTKPYGDAAIAAMSVVNRFSAFVLCVGLGVGQGFQPVASFNYQAKKYKRVKKGLLVTTLLGFVLISIFSLFGIIFADQIVYVFQKEEEVRKIGVFALRAAAVGMLFHPLAVPVNMLYQSIRKPGISSVLSMFRSGLALIPALLITTHFWGITGIQISQPIADMVTGLISVPFMLHFLFKTPNEEISEDEEKGKLCET